VLAALALAREHHTPLYPFSQGKNWGLGSRKPVAGGCLLLDLSALNRIKNLNLKEGYAVIEPGVTQRQLARRLTDSPFMLNVTGSFADTSIVGNALERGVGFLRQRTEDVAGLELLLGNGRIIRAGSFWPTGKPQFHYPHGTGPDFRSAFFQSNFGIVLSAAIALIPRPEYSSMFVMGFEKEKRIPALAVLKDLFANHFFPCVVKVREQGDNYVCFGALSGKRPLVRAQEELLRALMPEGTDLRFVDGRERQASPPEQVLFNAFNGLPYSGGGGRLPKDPDGKSPIGYRLLMPILPFEPEQIGELLQWLDELPLGRELILEKTLNLLSPKAVDLVLYLSFMRKGSDIARAGEMEEIILGKCREKGFFPYRHDIEHQNGQWLYGDRDYMDFLKAIGKACDPDGIIAPGRYR
jgi:4-cresol dehydrogenase (hydroxylating)